MIANQGITIGDRASLAQRGRRLEMLTIAWGTAEAALALTGAARQHSISLTGFGLDSLIEVASAAALLWRMSHELNHERKHHAERVSLRIAGGCLLALAGYVFVRGVVGLARGHAPEAGVLGIATTLAALICMPALSSAKRKVAYGLGSSAMLTDAKQTNFCMYQAAVVLLGLLAYALFGIVWADSAAALVLVPFLVRAGVLALQGVQCCTHH